MWLELAACAVLAFVLLWALASPDSRSLQLARHIPGPPSLPLIGNLFDIQLSRSEVLKRRKELIDKYGHVCRFWMGNKLVVILSDAEDIEPIMSSSVHITKSLMYVFMQPWLGTGLLTSNGEKWRTRRKAITPTFHFKILEQFIDVFNQNGEILVECLKNELGSAPFDIQTYISKYALDNICESAMGTKVNAQVDSKSEYVNAVRRICRIIHSRIRIPILTFDLAFALSGQLYAQNKTLKILHGVTNKVIEERKKELISMNGTSNTEKKEDGADDIGMKKKTAFLELLLNMANSSSETFVTNDDIREEVDTFMLGGYDTTTSGLSFTFCLLAKHQDVQERIYQELKELGISGRTTYQNLLDMKYTERVLKETLRLYPPVPVVSRILQEDITIKSGYTLPAGCMVAMSPFFIHRNEKYHKDPLVFNPDNFLPENITNRHPYAYIPFSAGPRNCIGQKYAMLEMKSAVAFVISSFKIEYAGPGSDPIPEPALVLQSENGFHIKLTQRI